ncbi:MAG: J domain-containing protein [Actinomycetota bacterium]
MTRDEAARLLGITPAATPAEIERAFKQRARMWHPDRFADGSPAQSAAAAAKFIRVTEARNLLLRPAAEPRPARPRVDSQSSTEPRFTTAGSQFAALPPHSRATAVWTFLLIVASILTVIGGPLPFSPWNVLLLVPLGISAIAYASTGRRGALIATLVFGAVNAALALAFASFGSLLALEILLAPVIALVVLGRRRRRAIRSR